ncbi:MAG TPA: hypothetical protein VJY62_18015, partial [Bacteroidia bacterium]|nr:hypothetical protein [Bacteroidia bacterium]
PASKKKLEELIENDGIKKIKFINDIERFSFDCASECDIEVNSLMQDLLYGDYNPVISSNENNCWFFYLFTSSGQIALISNRFYASENEAANAAASLKYIGAFRENFRTSITAQNKFSFYIELNFSGYAVYLQQIQEDETLYRKRREGFLNHLLSRFAERFTDFAILSYKFLDERELERQEIVKKENFLAHYDDLSSNRGRAYDYQSNGWNNENISGFEKRVAALAGIEDFKKHSLCNFVVQEKENGFVIKIKFRNSEEMFFVYKENIYSADFAKRCAKEIFTALNILENYQVIYDEILAEWRIKIFFKNTRQVYYYFNFREQETALAVCNGLHKLFSSSLSENDVHKYGEVFKCIVTNSLNEKICISKEPKKENEKDTEFLSRLAKQIIQPGNWDFINAEPINFEQIYLDNRIGEKLSFIDLKPFIINIYRAGKARRGKFQYDVKDSRDNFKLNSSSRFTSYDEAFKDCCRLLIHLTDVANYHIVYKKNSKNYFLQIKYDNRLFAESDLKYSSESDAVNALNEINRLAKQHLYFLSIEKPPPSWDFTFLLGYKKDEQFFFRSEKQFGTQEEAWAAGNIFFKNIPGSVVNINDAGKIILEQSITQSTCVCVSTQKAADKEKINSLLLLKSEIDSYMQEKEGEEGVTGLFEQFVAPEEVSDPALKFVYRLVDKDLLRAFYFYSTPADYDVNDKNSAEEKKIELFQDTGNYSHTEIYLSGDIIKKYPNSENPEWFHYQVKCSNKYNGVEGFVLFESVTGYVSEEEARKAFDENLHAILSNAMKADQYGEDVFISIEEKRIHDTDACIRNKNVVFIPDETKEIIRQNDEDVIKSLVIIAKKYPVRTITRDDNEFYTLFPCERDERNKTENNGCLSKTKTASLLYYFVLSDEEGVEKWQSVNYFHTFMEAMQQFNFFLILLEYPGNYCVQQDYCGCKWKIYIREVLAESKRKFPDKRTAWGSDGIEKFICISQSENAFQTCENENGCFSFNVSNGNMGLLHPCTYHTNKERNEAIRKLYEGAKDDEVWKFPEIKSGESDECILYDRDGNRFAGIRYDSQQNSSGTAPADGCLCLAELVYHGATTGFEKNDEDISVKINDKTSVVISRIDKAMGFEEWEKIFFKMCCQYPVVKKNNDTKFYIEFKLPGFGCCNDEINEQEPCRGNDKYETASCKCCIAWKSECCFESCYDAISYLIKNKDCLLDLSNYSPVFDCECGPFGIKLNCACGVDDGTGGNDTYKYSIQPVSNDEDGNRNPECCSEIVAFNPQRYSTPEMDCDAVMRAKKIINSEGLHLAEHILLRPRCPEDCHENDKINCPVKICDDKGNDMTKCKFPEFK